MTVYYKLLPDHCYSRAFSNDVQMVIYIETAEAYRYLEECKKLIVRWPGKEKKHTKNERSFGKSNSSWGARSPKGSERCAHFL